VRLPQLVYKFCVFLLAIGLLDIGLLGMGLLGMGLASRATLAQSLAPASSAVPSTALSEGELLRQAKLALDGGESRRAYEMLKAQESRLIGKVEFDYLLGLAALDVGYAAEAIIHLERVLINQPDFLQARAEIAKAYIKVQETENAKRELQTVAAQEIPQEVRRAIGNFLDLIKRDEEAAQKSADDNPVTWRGSIESEIGYDSNANFGTSSGTWLLADGTKVLPQASSKPNPSALLGLAGAVEAVVPINGRIAWTTGLRLSSRSYPSASTLAQSQVDLSTGLRIATEKAQFNVLAQTQNLRLDGNAFRKATGLAAQAQFELDSKNPGAKQWGLFAQAFDLSFPNAASRDAKRLMSGVSWASTIAPKENFLGLASVYSGRENAQLDTLSYSFTGLRGLLSRSLTQEWTGQISASFERRSFDGIDTLFGVRREDRQTELRLSAERSYGKHWLMTQEITWTKNMSSLQPNDYQRSQWRTSIKYKF
jgi:outer membrane protein